MIVMIAGMMIGIVIMLFGTNFCYSEEYQAEMKRTDSLPWYKKKTCFQLLISVGIVLIIGILMFVGSVHIDYYDTSFKVGATMTKSIEVQYSDITSIEYVDQLYTGSRKFGIGNAVIGAGKFKNTEFGTYQLYAYNQCDAHVIIHIDDQIIVINDKTAKKTKNIYNKIQSYIKNK